ncbi:MAG: PorT family protein [Tannerella sp.]|jgi:long-subunit fatty acid transport protein|nr:PorT family protein [Tannerella sp.]
MKYLLIGLCVVAEGLVHVSAQSKVHFLMKAGWNYTTITNLEKFEQFYTDPQFRIDIEPYWRSGMNVSLGFEWNVCRKFAIETGVGYAEYGARFTCDYLDIPLLSDTKYRISHLQVPLLAKYYVYRGLNVFAGPQVGYKISTEETSISISMFNDDIYYSGVAGLGYQFDFGLTVTAGYVHGLTNMDNYGKPNSPASNVKSLNAKSRAFLFNIGWRF